MIFLSKRRAAGARLKKIDQTQRSHQDMYQYLNPPHQPVMAGSCPPPPPQYLPYEQNHQQFAALGQQSGPQYQQMGQQHLQSTQHQSFMGNYSTVHHYSTTWLYCDIETSGLDPYSPTFGILEIAAAVTDDDLTVQETFHVVVHQPPEIIAASSRWCNEHFGPRHHNGNDLFAQSAASIISEREAGVLLEAFILKHAKKRRAPAAFLAADPRSKQKRSFFQEAAFGNITDLNEDAPPPLMAPDLPSPAPPVAQVPFGTRRYRPNAQQHEVYRVMLAGCSVHFDRQVLITRFPHLRKYLSYKIIDCTSVVEIMKRFRQESMSTLAEPQNHHRALPDTLEAVALLKHFWLQVLLKV